MKVVIIGGHLGPALALVEELQKRKNIEVFWIGRKQAMEGKEVPSLEYQFIPELGIPFLSITTGRLQRRFTLRSILVLFKIPIGLAQAFLILRKVKPGVIVSFGGYLSLPVIIAAWFLRIPSVVHEQTTVSGLANRIAARFAAWVAISYPTSAPDFPAEKTVLTGNPVRSEFFSKDRQKPTVPTLFVTAGSQGSQIINQAVEAILPTILFKMQVVHQTGILDFEKFQKKAYANYRVFANLAPAEMAKVMKSATLVVCRAGANTVSEIAAVGVPAILIPIPWVERNEQEKNARLLAQTKLARILRQENLTPRTLFGEIDKLLKNPPDKASVRRARRLVRRDAAKRLADMVIGVGR